MADTNLQDGGCPHCDKLENEIERLRKLVRERNDALVLASNYRTLLAQAQRAGFDGVAEAIDAAITTDQLNATLAERLASEQIRCSELKGEVERLRERELPYTLECPKCHYRRRVSHPEVFCPNDCASLRVADVERV